ncbi:MAG: thioredoxin domain-containing protein [Kofleriaceae bacterium]|nr:thioredoxin domain-containing protein [Kofleriaceae bacterium]
MRTWLLVGLLIAVGCADNDALEKRVQKLEKELEASAQDRRALERKLDELIGEFTSVRTLERKLDDLAAKQAVQPPPYRPRAAQPDPAKTYAVPIDGAPIEGRADAKVTMVWAMDYACPYCERVRSTVAELRRRYGNDLRVVYHQLVVHPATATASALAICAADKQGKFVRMDEALWEKSFKLRRFDKVGCELDPGGCEVMNGLARDVGLDLPRFQRDMKVCDQSIRARQEELKKLGANATPTFFINGRYISGARPALDFEAIIDEELRKANERIAQGASQKTYYEEWVLLNGEKLLAP